MQNPTGRDVLAGQPIETRLVEPVSLTSAQQSVPPCATHFAAEAVQSQQVGRDRMIRKFQDPLQHAPTIGTGSCRRWSSFSRIAVNVARIRFLAVTRTTWNLPCRLVPHQ